MPQPPKAFRDFPGDLFLAAFSAFLASLVLGLPRFPIITVDLTMPDRFEECRTSDVADGKQGYFIIEIYKSFHNDTSGSWLARLLAQFHGVDVRMRNGQRFVRVLMNS